MLAELRPSEGRIVMSENSTPEERTEMPTDKRWSKIRNEGTLPLSVEFNQVIVLIFSFSILTATASSMWNATLLLMTNSFESIATVGELSMNVLEKFLW